MRLKTCKRDDDAVYYDEIQNCQNTMIIDTIEYEMNVSEIKQTQDIFYDEARFIEVVNKNHGALLVYSTESLS